MKHIKPIIGIILIIAALSAMYYWNSVGKEKASEIQENEEIAMNLVPIEKPIRQRAYERNCSFFPISNTWIYAKSSLLDVGDFVAIYFKDTKEKIGVYEVAYIGESSIDLICKLKDFYYIDESVKKAEDSHQLILVMEEANV